jgi:hypothetical protein
MASRKSTNDDEATRAYKRFVRVRIDSLISFLSGHRNGQGLPQATLDAMMKAANAIAGMVADWPIELRDKAVLDRALAELRHRELCETRGVRTAFGDTAAGMEGARP